MKKGLILDSIWHSYSNRAILCGVYMACRPGDICGIFGQNGAGKSTLFKILAGQQTPDSGTVFINGTSCQNNFYASRFKHIAYLPQETMLPLNLSVEGFLKRLPVKCRHLLHDNFCRQHLHKKIRELSGGELRLFEVRILTSLKRYILVLDEPFTGIAPILIEEIQRELKAFSRQDNIVVISDHYYRDITKLVNRAYYLNHGTISELDVTAGIQGALQQAGYLTEKRSKNSNYSLNLN